MDKLNESMEAGLAPEYRRACVLGAGGLLFAGLAFTGVSVYAGYLEGQPGVTLKVAPVLFCALGAALLFMLGYTWRMRIGPSGVQVRFLGTRWRWRWEDFNQAEAGHYLIYFPHYPWWKRQLTCAYLDSTSAEKIWKILLEHVPPAEKWTGPFTVLAEPWSRITFCDDGIHIRHYLLRRFFSWDDLNRAVIFQSSATERGLVSFHLVFGKRTYRFIPISTLRGKKKGPGGFGVVEFLIDHVPGEKLIFCAPSGPPRSIAEYNERRKVLAKSKRDMFFTGLALVFVLLLLCLLILYALFDDWRSMGGNGLLSAITFSVILLAPLCELGYVIKIWREFRNEERQLDKERASLTPDDNG